MGWSLVASGVCTGCVLWLFAVVISVQLTHLMINVRHDCLLNRLILWPWPHQPLHSQCNPMPWFPSEKATKKNWSLCLPTVSTALPAARCYSSGCFDKAGCGETLGCKAGLCFHISTSGIKSAGCCNSHPEKNKKHWPACQTSASATTSCLKNGGGETEKTDSRRRM